MKGIILAGGQGTRLYPSTVSINKHLLPIYDKPMIYYPLSTLMLADITEILIITTPAQIDNFKNLLGNGKQWGIELSYAAQENPEGLAQAFIIAEDFLAGDSACLALGDNIFYGQGFVDALVKSKNKIENNECGACVYAYYVKEPERYGIVQFDDSYNVLSIEEKPKKPRSPYAVTGLYFYDNQVCELAKKVKPSPRGELEITDLNNLYLEKNALSVQLLGRGFAWLDTGTHESFMDAAQYIAAIEKRQGLKIGCVAEVAWRKGYIDDTQLISLADDMPKTGYSDYLYNLLKVA